MKSVSQSVCGAFTICPLRPHSEWLRPDMESFSPAFPERCTNALILDVKICFFKDPVAWPATSVRGSTCRAVDKDGFSEDSRICIRILARHDDSIYFHLKVENDPNSPDFY